MKKSILEITLFLIFSFQLSTVFGQAPQKLSYQAVIRNSSNSLVTNHVLGMQISILQGSGTGTPVYIEKQTPLTNQNGLVSVEIGSGVVINGSLLAINWANGPYFIKTETDPNGGSVYTITGVSELVSVPFALSAKTAGTANTANSVILPAQPAITSVGTLTDLTVIAPITGSVTGTASNVTGIIDPLHGGTGVNAASSNYIFAGPDGATGAPTFRALVPNDVPTGSTHYIANGTSPQALSDFNVTGSGTIGTALTIGGTLDVTGAADFVAIPTCPTATKGEYSTKLATTEFAQRAVNDAVLTPGYGVDITSGVVSTIKNDYAFLGINNTNGAGAQDLYLNWPYSDYIYGVTYSNGNTFTLRAGRMYEVTTTMYIYNAGAESYFYDFKNVTDNIEYSTYGAYFGEGTPYASYTTQTIRFMYKPAYDTDFQFQRSSTNIVDPNIVGNIIIKEIR